MKNNENMYETEDKQVSHPEHYQSESGLEVIDVIEAFTSELKGAAATDTGNIIKYACRWSKKNGIQDLKKILWYTQHLIDYLERKGNIALEKREESIMVLRRQKVETKQLEIGDQISIKLDGFGEFTATVQALNSLNNPIFMFDESITERRMNTRDTNKGGYEASDLVEWMKNVLLPAFPEELRENIIKLRLPTYGEIFGHDDYYNDFIEPDDSEQFELMKKQKNRIRMLNDDLCSYWLTNATKKAWSASDFAYVGDSGYANYGSASYSSGVCPVFLLDI